MTFDPQAYAAIAATNPVAAAQYLAAFQNTAAPAATPQAQPQQGYVNPAAVTPPQNLARGTLEDFYNQPTGGSAPSVTSKFFNKRPQGSWLQMSVLSDATNADVRQQQTPQGVPQTFRDGRPKFVLVVKVIVTGSSDGTHVAEFPDGEATIWVKGTLADELRRAMTAGGDASGYPKGGAQIVMQSAGEKPSRTPGFNATKLYTLQYAGPVMAAEAIANPQADLQAAAQAASGFANPTTQIPSATATSEPPFNTTTTAPSLTTPGAPAAVPTANFQPPVDPVPPPAPVAGNRDALLPRLHGQG